MAKIRIGLGSDFKLNDQKLGLGENNPQERLDVAGVAKGKDLKVTGIASFTAYEGFLRANHQIAENTTLSFDQGPVSSLSGEIIVGTGQTVTINEVIKETAGVGNGSGDQWFDINGNHAFVKVGTPTWNGNTFTLDGTDDYFTASGGDKDDFGFGTGDFTIEMWINAASGSIVPYDTRPASTNGDYTTIFIDSGQPYFDSDGAHKISGGAGDFPANVWNHVVVSRISATTKMYINGVQKGSDYSDSTNYLGVDGRPFIGAQSRTVGGSDVNGQISIVRVYKGRGLTLAEVTSNYNAGYTATTSAVAATVDLNANVPASYPGTVRDVDTTDVTRAGGSEIECLKVFNTFTPPSGGTNERPYAPKPGELYYNYDFKTIEFFDGNGWRQVDNTTRSGRAVFGGGTTPSVVNTIEYVQISTFGNALDFGDLVGTMESSGGCSSSTRGLFSGGRNPGQLDRIDYITIASAGNAIDFGNLTDSGRIVYNSVSSSTRGVNLGGYKTSSSANTNVIDYVELPTLGNALDFGDVTTSRRSGGDCNSQTRGIYAGGFSSTYEKIIESLTIASKGNTVRFGELANAGFGQGGLSNSVRGIMSGGNQDGSATGRRSTISHITIASEGNATYFGDLAVARMTHAAASNSIRGVFAGGYTPTLLSSIETISISEGGSALDFGDLPGVRRGFSGLSDSHGGLGGF